MSDRHKSFDFATETTKQLITLSTAVLTLTIAFAKDILGGEVSSLDQALLAVTWVLYLISIVFGVMTMQALTYSTASGGNIDDKPVRVLAILQNLFFLAATMLIVGFGISIIA